MSSRKALDRRFKQLKIFQYDVPAKCMLDKWTREWIRLEAFEPVEGPPGPKKGVVQLTICTEGWKGPPEQRPPHDFARQWTTHDYTPIELAAGAVLQQMIAFGWSLGDCLRVIRRRVEEYLRRHPGAVKRIKELMGLM